MFKRGGPADQGTGILSHVEPRRVHRAMGGRMGYAEGIGPVPTGGFPQIEYTPRPQIGYTPPVNSTLVNTAGDIEAMTGTGTTNLSNYEKGAEWRRNLLNKAKFSKFIPRATGVAETVGGALGLGALGPSVLAIAPFYGIANAAPLTGQEKIKQDTANKLNEEYYGKARRDMMADVMAGRKSEAVSPYKYIETAGGNTPPGIDDVGQVGVKPDYYQAKNVTPDAGYIEPKEDLEAGEIDPETGKKKPITKEGAASKPDKTAVIKKEADYIRSLIDDPEMSKAEVALIIGKALSTPGPIANKIQVASDEASKLAKDRSKTSRDITLRAYEYYKELEKADIAAGKPTEHQKMVTDAVNNEMANAKVIAKNLKGEVTYDGKTIPEIKKDVYEKMNIFKEARGPMETIISNAMKELIPDAVNKIEELEAKRLEKGKLSKDEEKELAKRKKMLKPFSNDPLFLHWYPKGSIPGLAEGGRVNYAMGTPNPQQKIAKPIQQSRPANVEQTVVTQNNQDVSLKPVNKLGYNELRERLPKEITDDIVMLISKSDQALQEFAYIRTQKDVNDFNVRYGVNLLLPATPNS